MITYFRARNPALNCSHRGDGQRRQGLQDRGRGHSEAATAAGIAGESCAVLKELEENKQEGKRKKISEDH